MLKCDFNKVALQLYIKSINLLHIFGTLFPRNASGGLLPTKRNRCRPEHPFTLFVKTIHNSKLGKEVQKIVKV